MTAIRLGLERVLSPRKCRPLKVSLPKFKDIGDTSKAVNDALMAVSDGDITTDEADALLRTVPGDQSTAPKSCTNVLPCLERT